MTFAIPYYFRFGKYLNKDPCCCCIRKENGVLLYPTDNKPYFEPNPFDSILLTYETYNLLSHIPGPYQGLWNRAN